MALTDNLQAFYKLSDTSDSSGNNRTLTNNGNVSFASGKIGNAAVFDGSGYLNVEDTSFAFSGDFSISSYFKLTQAMNEDSFAHIVQGVAGGDTPGDWFFGIAKTLSWANNANGLAFGTHWAIYPLVTAEFSPELNTWYHAAVKRSNGTITLYINGQAIGSAADTNPRTASGLSFGKSDGSGGGALYGSVDAFGIWNRALSDAEFAALCNNGTGLELDGVAQPTLVKLQAPVKFMGKVKFGV
jgi:sialidase-1